MDKPIKIKFDKDAYISYKHLQDAVAKGLTSGTKPTYEQLLTSVNNAIRNIKADYRYGDLIPRKELSKKAIQKYGTDKICRVELVGFWRLLYTIIGDEVKIVAFILEFIDHPTYDKIFKSYKRK